MVALNPLAVLSRGYGAIFDDESKVVKSVNDVEIGDEILVKVSDGTIKAQVNGKVE